MVAASVARFPRTGREQIAPADANGKSLLPRRNFPTLLLVVAFQADAVAGPQHRFQKIR
jgi:hypothetical protein